MNEFRYNKLSAYLKQKFGERVEKLCLDGGFTCPNRDGTCGYGGCIFCGAQGSGGYQADRQSPDFIKRQITDFFAKPPKNGAKKFVAYFQNFTNTYAPTEVLKSRYDAATQDDRVVALAIGTRPDCLSDEIIELLSDYAKSHYVWVELGLQTANDNTAELINRGYKSDIFTQAVNRLTAAGIQSVAHVIFGLPQESDDDVRSTIDFVNKSGVSGIKIHSLYVEKATRLADLYYQGRYSPQTFDEYISRLVYAITHLRHDLIVHRITGDCNRGALIAPDWNNRKKLIRNALERELKQRDLTQGCFFNK